MKPLKWITSKLLKTKGGDAAMREALPPSAGIDSDEHLFRPVSGKTNKDLTPFEHQKMLELSFWYWNRNPIANRIVELAMHFTVGDGITFQAEDKVVHEVLTDFWNDPVNKMNIKVKDKSRELGLWGEQCYPVFINPENGHVKLGNLEPLAISSVIADKENTEILTQVIPKTTSEQTKPKPLDIISVDEDPDSDTFGFRTGDTFYFAINKTSTERRGRSDLFKLIDWISCHDQNLFNLCERAAFMRAFIWDVTLDGMSASEIKDWLKTQPAPPPGSIRAHNEKATWAAVTPDLKAGDEEKLNRLIKNFILSGAGYPPHWFADGMDVNRATAKEMNEPTKKSLKERQDMFKAMLVEMFEFVIDQAIIAATLKKEVNRKFKLFMPTISIIDAETAAKTYKEVSITSIANVQAGLMSKKTAVTLISIAAQELGLDIDVTEELRDLEKVDPTSEAFKKFLAHGNKHLKKVA